MRTVLLTTLPALLLLPQTSISQAPKDLAVLSGRVTGANGLPLRKAALILRPSGANARPSPNGDRPQPYGVNTDAEGKYIFNGVEAGVYMLSVQHTGYVAASWSKNPAKTNISSPLTLAAGQTLTGIDIKMVAQGSISGRVFDEDGEPAARFQVRAVRKAYSRNGSMQQIMGTALTDDEGSFHITGVNAGKYLLMASPAMTGMFNQVLRKPAAEAQRRDEGPAPTWYPGSLDQSQATAVEVPEGGNLAGINIRLVKTLLYRVKGQAAGASPADASSGRVRVVVMPRDGGGMFSMEKSSAVAKDGSYEIAGLAPGSYNLMLLRMEGQTQVLASAPLEIREHDLEGQALTGVEPVEVAGIIRTEAGPSQNAPDPNKQGQAATAAPGFRVSLSPAVESVSFFGVSSVAAKDDGTFTLQRVGAGRYRVSVLGTPAGSYVKSVKYGGRETVDTGLDIAGGGAGSLEILISPNGGKITGTVQDAEGKPAVAAVTAISETPGRNDLAQFGRSSDTGAFSLQGLTPGRYRVFATTTVDGAQVFDPDYIRLHESEGQRVTIEEGGSAQLTITQR